MKNLKNLVAASVIAIGIVSGAAAQTETTTTTTTAAPAVVVATDTDASQIREHFRELLERHPPQVGKVLKLDPTLFTNAAYLANYPQLAAFVAQHPEVAHSPSFYLENVWVGDARPESASERVWRDAVEGFAIFVTMGLVALVLSWLVRTLIQHRRWSRRSAAASTCRSGSPAPPRS